MDNVLIDRSASGFEFQRRWSAAGDDDFSRSFAMAMSALPPPDSRRSIYGSFPHLSPPLLPFQYAPHLQLQSSLSLPPLQHPRRRRHPPLPPLPPPPAAKGTKPAAPPRRTTAGRPSSSAAGGECKRKKPPRTPRPPPPPGEEAPATPRAAQRRKPLERAAALPAAAAVHEALDDLERLVTRGFVEDLVHALAAPPPSSLPLPTFSLLRSAAAATPTPTKAAVVPSPCTA